MNELMIEENIKIENLIYEVRGKYVMLDRDLAILYGVKTKILIQSVKRNISRFPENFMFQLTNLEFINWRSQFLTSKSDKQGLRRPPYVFTEQGVAMLSGVLRSEMAIKTSISIINAFISMRKYIKTDLIHQKFVDEMLIRHDNDIKLLQESFDKLSEKEVKNEIYFNGQIYDAYSKILDIISIAKEELIIIDAYTDKITLDIISKLNIKVIIITSNKTR